MLVDGDACPVRREIERVTARLGVGVTIFANESQDLADAPHIRIILVPDGRDAVDFALFTECRPGDVVVTDDLGLAAMVLGKGAAPLSSRGRGFTREAMPARLETRHAARKARRAGKRTPGPRAATPADRRRFIRALESLLFARLRNPSAKSLESPED